MEIALRLPRIAVADLPITAGFLAVPEGAEVKPGDRLFDLRIGTWPASFHAEVNGVVRDIRAFPGDELLQDRVVMFVEAAEPPPIRAARERAPEMPAGDDGCVVFRLPQGLLRARTPVLVNPLAAPGDLLQPGRALLEFAIGPIRMVWPAPGRGVLERFLLRPGDALPDGAPVAHLQGAAATRAGSAPEAPAPLDIPELGVPEFRRRAAALAERAAELAGLIRDAGLAHSAASLEGEREKLSACRFTVAVVGEFKRGKSTFLNALAGRELLPHDVVPCTAFACRFQYADRLRLTLLRNDGAETATAADSFPAIAAELDRLTHDPQAAIREAIVGLPLPLCRDGVDLLDTPGLNDSEAMNQLTLAVLPNVDAAVLLLIPESPVSETERRFLQDHLLARDLARVLYVLNAADRVPPSSLGRVVGYMENQLRRIVGARGAQPPSLLPVSSQRELLHPETPDTGFAALRRELDRLLFRERGRLRLIEAITRIRDVCSESIAVLELRGARQAISRESFHAFLREMERQLGATRLHSLSLRRRLLEGQTRAESAAAARAAHLHLALLALRESLPAAVSLEHARQPAGEIKAEFTAALAQHAGRLYQQALNSLFEDVREIYRPLALAVREFVENARGAFLAEIAGCSRGESGVEQPHPPPPPRLQPPDSMQFGGPLGLRIDLSLGAMSWLYLADSVKSLLTPGEFTASLEARAVEKLRSAFAREIEAQVRSRAAEPILAERLSEFACAPFNQLIRGLDQDLKILLDDSYATLASLQQAPPPDAHSGLRQLRERIAALAAGCEAIAFAAPQQSALTSSTGPARR